MGGVSSQLPHHLEGSSSHSEINRYNHSHSHSHRHCHSDSHSYSYNYTCNSLSVLYFNARSIVPKFDALCSEVEIHKPDIVCLVESWLSDEVLDSEISLTNYQLYRLDRNRHGGGIIIYIHNNLTTELITKGAYSLEFLAVSVSNGISKFCISLFYRPPSSPVHVMDSLFTTLETLNISSFTNFVLIGDFNINFHNPSCFLYPKLSNILQSFSLSQVVQDATHNTRNGSETLIDLALVSSADHVKDCSVIPPLLNSDHNGILLKLKWKQGGQQTLSHKRKIWRYAHADFIKACNLIENTNWDSVITGNVNEALANWENTYMQIMEECIPQKTIPKKSNLPWLTRDILRVGRRRTLLYRRAKKSGSTT